MVFFCIFGFLYVFVGVLKTFGKTKKTNKTKPISKGGSETVQNFVLFVFPKVFLVLFGFLLYCWFSLMFFWLSKNLRENNKKKTYPRVGLKPSTTLFFFVFPNDVLVFVGFLWYFWFSRRCFWFSKNLRENHQKQKNKPISKGGSETFKNFVCLFSRRCFWCSLVFFGVCWVF